MVDLFNWYNVDHLAIGKSVLNSMPVWH